MSEMKEESTDVKKDIKKLIDFVDKNFQPTKWQDVLQAFPFFKAILILLIILLVYLIALSPFTPLIYQIPWAISYAALLLTTASVMKALQREVQASLLKLRVEQMYPKLDSKSKEDKKNDERVKYLLYALLAMKIRNPYLKLSLIYDMDESLFDKDSLLTRLYEARDL